MDFKEIIMSHLHICNIRRGDIVWFGEIKLEALSDPQRVMSFGDEQPIGWSVEFLDNRGERVTFFDSNLYTSSNLVFKKDNINERSKF